MSKQIAHEALRWLPRAVFAGVLAVCAIWDRARDAVGDVAFKVWPMMANPFVGAGVIAVIVAYFVLLVWTGRVTPAGVIAPDMPLHEAARYLARDSCWAANYPSSDDNSWPSRVDEEMMSKLLLGHLSAFGRWRPDRMQATTTALDTIPIDFLKRAQWHSARLATSDPPTHMWRSGSEGGGIFLSVMLNRKQVEAVWPKKPILARLGRVSPVQRLPYKTVFLRQDEAYLDFKSGVRPSGLQLAIGDGESAA